MWSGAGKKRNVNRKFEHLGTEPMIITTVLVSMRLIFLYFIELEIVKKGFVYEDALLNAFYFEKMVEPILSIYKIG